MTLRNKSKNTIVAQKLERADGIFARMKGLLGRSSLADSHALFINHCNSIHTFFMKFSIDVIFVNKAGVVTAVYDDVKPGRFIWPVFKARAVYEAPVGTITLSKTELGDQLDVVP